jgi:hypothetical protein
MLDGSSSEGEDTNLQNGKYANLMKQDLPEIKQISTEFAEALEVAHKKLAPVMNKVQKTLDKELKAEESVDIKYGMTYLEMKYNLMLTYSNYLCFYMLLKITG